ncbi:PE-PPE domain-containing protein [Mycobacterium sp. EPG1]|nr:PE-PPE domain-containing protein [Mycobacterium sp. EPG1]
MRKSGVVCGTVFASAALALSAATPGMAANTALIIGGISTPSLTDPLMAPLLGGKFKDQQRVSVKWPAQAGPMTGRGDLTLGASIAQGKTNLTAQINNALGQVANGEKVTVVGLSAGSLVVNEVLRELEGSADAPGKDKITFVVVADSSRQKVISQARYNSNFDYTYQPAPETKYDVIVVTGEYDGMADFPDRWWNVLAIANAIAGGIYVHVPVMYADLSKVPAQNISVDTNSVGGTTTHYLVPTEKLPLVRMFPSLAKREAELRAKIDAGYSRNDVVAQATPNALVAAAAPVALATPVAEVPSSVTASLRTPKAAVAVEDTAAVEAAEDSVVDTAGDDVVTDSTSEAAEDKVVEDEAVADKAAADEAAADEAAADEAADATDADTKGAEDADSSTERKAGKPVRDASGSADSGAAKDATSSDSPGASE